MTTQQVGNAAAPDRVPPSGDFQTLTDPYRRELLVHSYRFLGSFDDAEDALQEALLRAWRRMDSLKEQNSLRPWLYRIVTNVSLDMLANRKARSMPDSSLASADPEAPLPVASAEPLWLQPLPDEYLAGLDSSPEARYELHESIRLAFLALLQRLPARQRAALILRDVLGWKAQEVASLLDTSVQAINSALQRARETMKQLEPAPGSGGGPWDLETARLVDGYLEAWEAGDVGRLVSLLRDDAILTMPPLTAWFRGSAAIGRFFGQSLFAGEAAGRFRVALSRANGCPAVAVYQADKDGAFRPASLQVLQLAGGQIVRIDCFLTSDERLLARFGLPAAATLPRKR
jgi:RNA polymerase sigma-70 factor (ECF subfamily)